jgi:hypothetical protein
MPHCRSWRISYDGFELSTFCVFGARVAAALFGFGRCLGEGTRMLGANPPDVLESATHALRDLALRRHAYYLDLLRSGRWRHYFSEQQFAERLRDVVMLTRRWNGLAGAPADTKSAA